MYSLLVTELNPSQKSEILEFRRNRYLEYTSQSISSQLKLLSNQTVDCLKAWPCLLMEEGRGQESAHIGKIESLQFTDDTFRVGILKFESTPQLINDAIWRSRNHLDIEQFEFNRNHWAVKDRDLLAGLRASGYSLDAAIDELFDNKPLPAPARAELVHARKLIAELGHSEIDEFLLEAGVEGLSAGREIGSRRDRANAIIEFAIQNPSALTAEHSLFSWFIINSVTVAHATTQTEEIIPSRSDSSSLSVKQPPSRERSRSPNRVFIVHGQNEELRSATVNFLTSLGLEGVVLHEQPSMGRHLLTKFIDEAELTPFAIVLMTDDDMGGLKGGKLAPRARQNVILELGYFLSHLGQERVCALITPGLETPSDFDGIVYIRMESDERWKNELKRELIAAGMPVSER